jgi:tetratricopeptide (TPR) repeat protein
MRMGRTTGGILLAAILAAGLGACGTEQAGRGDRASEARALGLRFEAEGTWVSALNTYRDATRRYPTESWPWAGLGRAAERLGRMQDAETAYRTAVRWDSTGVEAPEGLARILAEDARHEESLRWIDEALRREAGPERIALRSRVLADLDRPGEARRTIDRALAASPDNVAVRTASAYVRIRSGETSQAAGELEQLQAEHPEDPRVHEEQARLRLALGDPEGAEAAWRVALEADPDRPPARRALASLLLAMDRVPEAKEQFRILLENDPRNVAALEGLGVCARATGDDEAAEEAFGRALEADPEYAPAYLALGELAAGRGRGDEAIGLLRKARARATDPATRTRCARALGDLYLQLGEPDHALEVADALLRREPESEEARSLRGRALAAGGAGNASGEALERLASRPEASRDEVIAFVRWLLERGDDRRALSRIDEYLATQPADAPALVLRARALTTGGRTDEAETTLHDLLAQRPDDPDVHRALAELYLQAQRHPDAIHHAREGERLAPEDPVFPALLGRAALEEGRLEDALGAITRRTTLAPADPDGWIQFGKLRMRLGDPAAAVPLFEKARELEPEDWTPAYLLGLAYSEAGRPEEAIAAYRSVLANNERVAEAHNNLAWLLADLDLDPVLAEVHARRATELAPGNPDVLGTLGWAQYKNRLLDEAAETLGRAVELRPEDAMKHYMLGVVNFHLGRLEVAASELDAALSRDAAFPRADRARDLRRRIDR